MNGNVREIRNIIVFDQKGTLKSNFSCANGKKREIPVLALERELYGGGEGQMRTRVQAFFEQVKNKKDIDESLVRLAGTDIKGKDPESVKYS